MEIKKDFWVEHTQMWLNNTFGNHSEWVRLSENGLTGTNTMQGLIRAFQINNGISPATGEVGPATRAKFKSLNEISKMDPDGPEDLNVYIIQGALFCKGYNAGGLTGIFYNSGVTATKKLQDHSSIDQTGSIGWKEWSALLSMNWFTLVDGGNIVVRMIQRQLNHEFSTDIGVGPCDGIVSRHTALSLIAALQSAEGIEVDDDLNGINFGNETTKRFPNPPLQIDQNSEYYQKFNRLVQYSLYFNGYDTYRWDGIFDAKTQMCVNEFQSDYGLLGIGLVDQGIVNVSTMKSLLTSKGDTNRKAYACDCATILNATQAIDLKNSGYTHVGRYLTGTVGVGSDERPKAITLNEIENIKNSGLSVFPIYQDGGYYSEYFQLEGQGSSDALSAITASLKLGVPSGATIYFAVDYDCYGYEIDDHIIPYFKEIKKHFDDTDINIKRYNVGIYAARNVCTIVSNKNLAKTSFVCDMSTGFSGNLGFPIPKNWAFDQFYEYRFYSSPSFDLDENAYSGRDKGFSNFDKPMDVIDINLLKELNKVSLGSEFGLYIDSPIGKKTSFDLGVCKVEYDMSLQTQIKGDYLTIDFKNTPTVDNPLLTTINGVTLENGILGASLSKDQEATLYAYLVKFDNLKARFKFTINDSSIKFQIEILQPVIIDDKAITLSEMFTIEFKKINIDGILQLIKEFCFDHKNAIALISMVILIIVVSIIVIPASIFTSISSIISTFITGLLSILKLLLSVTGKHK